MALFARWTAALLLALLPLNALAAEPVRVAAAADLRPALTQIAADFRRATGGDVQITFGSSGMLAQQIARGAPFDLFLSADESYVQQLARDGRTVDGGALYAIGRLALVAPKGSPLRLDGQLHGLRTALAQGRITRFAIANPDHAPYGARAREALQRAGLWSAIQPRLVLGDNVAQALQFATAGAQGGIVSSSLVRDPAVAARVNHVLIPASWHRPLRQRMVLVRGAAADARALYAFVRQPAARRTLVRFGFTLPESGAR